MTWYRWLYVWLLALVLIGAGLLSYRHRDLVGLAGYGAGAVLALGLCMLSHRLHRAAQRGRAEDAVRLVMIGVLVSFVTIIGSVIVVRVLWPRALACFALTAVSVYLTHRLLEAVRAGLSPSAMVVDDVRCTPRLDDVVNRNPRDESRCP